MKLGTLPKDKRFRYPKTMQESLNEYADMNVSKVLPVEMSQVTWDSSITSKYGSKMEGSVVAEAGDADPPQTMTTKPKPVRRFKKPVTNEDIVRKSFDTSSYDRMKKSKPLDLNPIVINKLSKSQIFNSAFARIQGYESKSVKSNVAENIKKHI